MPYTPDQQRRIDLARRLSAGHSRRTRLALFEAMAVEANYRSPSQARSDRDSEGPLQQRPSQGWGPASESDATDIRQFLDRAAQAERQGFKGTPGQLAQHIQRSAYPGRYDQRADEAARLLGLRGGGGRTASLGSGAGAGGQNPGLFAAPDVSDLRKQLALSLIQGRPLQETLGLIQAIRQPPAPASSSPAGPRIGGPGPPMQRSGTAIPGGGITYSGQRSTHPTAGLEGYPAVDLFAKPGTPFTAPEDGEIIRHSGRGGTSGNVYGRSVYFRGKSGRTYFITHLGTVAPKGRYRKGQPLGTVSPWTGGAPHAHVGVHG